MRKTWEVLGRKLVFGQLWGPLDDFEQNGTEDNLVLKLD